MSGRDTLKQRLRQAVRWGVFLSLLGGALGFLKVRDFLQSPIADEGGFRTVVIPKGANFNEIMGRLVSMGVVRDRTLFELYVRSKGYTNSLKAGAYQIDLKSTPHELLQQLVKGAALDEVQVTLPEGLNRWQVADILSGVGLVDREAFLQKVQAEDLEGRLFPETYRLGKNWSLDRVVGALTQQFDAVYAEVIAGHPNAANLNTPAARSHLVTLASLIEKEGQGQEDRRLISRVFHNRLA
ncbi:MAG: endolytic transglycosylase MltG, partial [Myxococcales bacterium]|nr:endolytic transglycosylase MltG [Myxococcales bacterium]